MMLYDERNETDLEKCQEGCSHLHSHETSRENDCLLDCNEKFSSCEFAKSVGDEESG